MNGHWTNRLRTKTKQGERRKKTRNENLAKKEHKPEERKIITGKEILNNKRKSAKIRENNKLCEKENKKVGKTK